MALWKRTGHLSRWLSCRQMLAGESHAASSKFLFSYPLHDSHASPSVRAFSSLLAKWNNIASCNNTSDTVPRVSPHFIHQQVRHVYVEVIDNDIDAAVKIYRKKMLNTKVEAKLREKRYYSKPSERRKLAKHYKKLNRARRELSAKIRTVKHRMEKIQEVRKFEKDEKRARAAASQGQKSNER